MIFSVGHKSYLTICKCTLKTFFHSKKFLTYRSNHQVMQKIEHIGIAVKNLKESGQLFISLMGIPPYKQETVPGENVTTLFFKLGQTKIELLEATQKDSVIAKFIEKRGEGMHHIAFEVTDIEAEMNRLKDEGFILLNDAPKKGADNKLVCFLHPKSTNGVLIELCQEIQ
jgi:methylmalonyl-CoA/ethylmalonyl-CoA epimerase